MGEERPYRDVCRLDRGRYLDPRDKRRSSPTKALALGKGTIKQRKEQRNKEKNAIKQNPNDKNPQSNTQTKKIKSSGKEAFIV